MRYYQLLKEANEIKIGRRKIEVDPSTLGPMPGNADQMVGQSKSLFHQLLEVIKRNDLKVSGFLTKERSRREGPWIIIVAGAVNDPKLIWWKYGNEEYHSSKSLVYTTGHRLKLHEFLSLEPAQQDLLIAGKDLTSTSEFKAGDQVVWEHFADKVCPDYRAGVVTKLKTQGKRQIATVAETYEGQRVVYNLHLDILKPATSDNLALVQARKDYENQFKVGALVKVIFDRSAFYKKPSEALDAFLDGYARVKSVVVQFDGADRTRRKIEYLDGSVTDNDDICLGNLHPATDADVQQWLNATRKLSDIKDLMPGFQGLHLNSWEGCPEIWEGPLFVANNTFKDFNGAPKVVSANFDISNNPITSLEGCPKDIGLFLKASGCLIDKFVPGGIKVVQDVNLNKNKLTSLQGIHKQFSHIGGKLYLSLNDIKSHVLSVLLIPGLQEVVMDNQDVERIINKYLGMGGGRQHIMDCQAEIIEAGFEDLAQL